MTELEMFLTLMKNLGLEVDERDPGEWHILDGPKVASQYAGNVWIFDSAGVCESVRFYS